MAKLLSHKLVVVKPGCFPHSFFACACGRNPPGVVHCIGDEKRTVEEF